MVIYFTNQIFPLSMPYKGQLKVKENCYSKTSNCTCFTCTWLWDLLQVIPDLFYVCPLFLAMKIYVSWTLLRVPPWCIYQFYSITLLCTTWGSGHWIFMGRRGWRKITPEANFSQQPGKANVFFRNNHIMQFFYINNRLETNFFSTKDRKLTFFIATSPQCMQSLRREQH